MNRVLPSSAVAVWLWFRLGSDWTASPSPTAAPPRPLGDALQRTSTRPRSISGQSARYLPSHTQVLTIRNHMRMLRTI